MSYATPGRRRSHSLIVIGTHTVGAVVYINAYIVVSCVVVYSIRLVHRRDVSLEAFLRLRSLQLERGRAQVVLHRKQLVAKRDGADLFKALQTSLSTRLNHALEDVLSHLWIGAERVHRVSPEALLFRPRKENLNIRDDYGDEVRL